MNFHRESQEHIHSIKLLWHDIKHETVTLGKSTALDLQYKKVGNGHIKN